MARPIHEKDMYSYALHAWRDAQAIGLFIEEEFGAATARKIYESRPHKDVLKFETENSSLISDFIQKSESHRPAFLSRVCKSVDTHTKVLFLVLCLIGIRRTIAIIGLRDKFRTELAPGRGNRVTTASLYDFSLEMLEVYDYSWPTELFDSLDLDEDFDTD